VEYKKPSAVLKPGSSHFSLNKLRMVRLAVTRFLNNSFVAIVQFARKYPGSGP
jgi:hypothetical protein